MSEKHTDARTYYSDIFSTPHWEPVSSTPTGMLKHPRMTMEKRAAIFASFDALSGYKEATIKTAKAMEQKLALSLPYPDF